MRLCRPRRSQPEPLAARGGAAERGAPRSGIPAQAPMMRPRCRPRAPRTPCCCAATASPWLAGTTSGASATSRRWASAAAAAGCPGVQQCSCGEPCRRLQVWRARPAARCVRLREQLKRGSRPLAATRVERHSAPSIPQALLDCWRRPTMAPPWRSRWSMMFLERPRMFSGDRPNSTNICPESLHIASSPRFGEDSASSGRSRPRCGRLRASLAARPSRSRS